MKDRIVLVTGATAGIGKVTAQKLRQLGARVVIVGRNREKTQRVATELDVEWLLADLSSLADIRKLAQQVDEKYGALHVLVNNAGGVNMTYGKTVDGIERTLATNHLAYFLLANLLLPALEKGAATSGKKSRIINVASEAHRYGPMRFDALNPAPGQYQPWAAYGMSKLANILFTRELARRLQGKPIVVNAVHPGFVASDFLSKGGVWRLIKPIAYLFAITEEQGADTSVYLASAEEADQLSGKYFIQRHVRSPRRFAQDDVAARRLWDESAKLVGLPRETN